MKDRTIDIYNKFGRFSFWLAIFGLISYMLYFPNGLYYCFFCGVMSIALALSAHAHSSEAHYAGGFIMGIVDVVMSAMAFYGLYLIYASLSDPDAQSIVNEFFSSYGIPPEVLGQILR